MKIYAYFSFLPSILICSSAFAACTSAPDCQSLGYTESSCPNGGIKCPFDTSKWRCSECGADYKYTCSSRVGETGGAGTPCGGKFTKCQCVETYFWNGYSCINISGRRETNGYCCDENCTGDKYSDCLKGSLDIIYGQRGTLVSCTAMSKGAASFSIEECRYLPVWVSNRQVYMGVAAYRAID